MASKSETSGVPPQADPQPSNKNLQTSRPDEGGEKLPWNPWGGVLFVTAMFFSSQIVANVLVSIYPAARHFSAAQASAWLTNSIPGQFIYLLLAEGLLVLTVYLFLKSYHVKFRAIGLKKPRWRDLLYGLTALPGYILLYLIAVAIIGAIFPTLNTSAQQDIGFQSASGTGPLIITFLSLVIIPPFVEELVMRGFLYGTLRQHMAKIIAALITSVLFAAAHLPEGSAGAGPLWIAFIDTFILSLFLVYLREKTGSLWASITLHGLKNFIAFASLFIFHLS